MLIPNEVWVALTDAGVTVRQRASDEVDLILPTSDGDLTAHGAVDVDGDERAVVGPLRVKVWNGPLKPSTISRQVTHQSSRHVLALATTVSAQAYRLAARHGWSVMATNRHTGKPAAGVLLGPGGRTVHIGIPDTEHPGAAGQSVSRAHRSAGMNAPGTPTARRGRSGYGVSTIMRRLLTGVPQNQAHLVATTTVSQSRISQVLSRLTQEGLLRRIAMPTGPVVWEPSDWDGLLNHFFATYPGPGGTTTYWYGLEDPRTTAQQVLDHLDTFALTDEPQQPDRAHASSAGNAIPASASVGPALSGLAALDLVAHWVRPTYGIVYPRLGADLQQLGLTPAPPEQATLHLVVPADPGVWPVRGSWPKLDEAQVADPVQILWDVSQAPAVDADQAMHKLRSTLAGAAAAQRDPWDARADSTRGSVNHSNVRLDRSYSSDLGAFLPWPPGGSGR